MAKINNPNLANDTELPRRSLRQRLLALGLIVLLLASGVLLSRYIIKTRPQVKRNPPKKIETLVRAMTVVPGSAQVTIRALGQVVAAREITLQARVSGQVVYLHPAFIPGGIIAEDEIMLKLDDTDYQLNLRQQEDALALAQADLRIEEGSQTVARKEWELITALTDDVDVSSRDLALRKPQLAKAEALIKSAQTALERARIDLERTVIRAPFNLVVRAENIDLGSEVSTSAALATLAATDVFWAEIAVAADKLAWFTLPDGRKEGSPVLIRAGENAPYQGRIISLAPDLDKDGLMARILVAIDDPLGLQSERRPLLLGGFIQAEIAGRSLENVYQIPRSALHENDMVMLADSENRLQLQKVSVVWKGVDTVFVSQGLTPQARVVVSSLAAPISGMPLKVEVH
ncbi:MAG: efflux RND transporter periplasmic adaptor subunit [Deltaproteobacteria bacterium]|nr:efflux RND transporter periplasmic adaptor subunit [Deltaproteobacteria bacterium]